MKLDKLTNSLFVAALNVVFGALAFTFFVYPRFTNIGLVLCILIFVLAIADVVLVLRDLFRSGTRGRAIVAVLLWLPILFLFGMITVWEGPVYVAASGDPPAFQLRGLAGVCGIDIYGPDHGKAEWVDDEIGLIWRIHHTVRFPFEAKFKYGEVPSGFEQIAPEKVTPPPLNSNVLYEIVVDRCMGGTQDLALRGDTISEYRPDPNACWGELRVPERQNPAYVRVDCNSRQPLPMSKRATERLKQYRENRIAFY